jgi:hypothetical protein
MIDHRAVLIAVAVACLATGACDKKAATGNKATGEVLEGTISDEMISTDRVRSDPPLAPHASGAPAGKPGKAKTAPGQAEAAGEAPATDATPTPETAPALKPPATEPAQ